MLAGTRLTHMEAEGTGPITTVGRSPLDKEVTLCNISVILQQVTVLSTILYSLDKYH